MSRTQDYGVRVQLVNRKDEVVLVEKFFTTDAARTKWLDDDRNDVVQVMGYTNPREDF